MEDACNGTGVYFLLNICGGYYCSKNKINVMKTVIQDIKKLPRWAKNRIEKLEADIIYWKRKADQIAGDEETNTYVNYSYDNKKPLPKNARVEFDINGAQVEIRIDGDSIDVRNVSFSSSERILITPRTSNSFSILFAKVE